MSLCERAPVSRRAILGIGGACFGWAFRPRWARAAGARDSRFVTIVLRGALDGLSAVAPLGDPDYADLHGVLALSRSGDHAALPLDGFFGLNPAMPTLARLFQAKQACVVHAVSTGYRERSHFDGQDVLESGYPGPGRTDSGWLNRALIEVPRGERLAPKGLAVGAVSPLIMRGGAEVLGWAPRIIATAGDDLSRRVLDLYGARDPVLAAALRQGLATEAMAVMEPDKRRNGADTPGGMRLAAEGAARLLAADDGPRIAALAFDGWDTHVNEGGATGRLAQLLGELDAALSAFERELGAAWRDTVIAIVTEFGRTARINGTVGTDHGTGTVMILAGGGVNGGRVIADWPGLKIMQLHEERDLRPTLDVRSILKGILQDQWGLSREALDTRVFPDSALIKATSNLLA